MAADEQLPPDAEVDPAARDPHAEGTARTGVAHDGAAMYALGRVGRPHTLDGSFVVTKPKVALLTEGTVVRVGDAEHEIVRRSGTDAKPILRLSGVDGIAAAEALRGTDLLIPRDALPELDDDEFWPDELVGLPVRATTGEPVGEVAEVLVMPSVDVLRVRWTAEAGRADLLVPLHRDAVPTLDIEGRDVAIDLGFLDERPPGTGPEDA